MLDIQQELSEIRDGQYGSDIRFPIFSALDKLELYFNYGVGPIIPDPNEEGGGTQE